MGFTYICLLTVHTLVIIVHVHSQRVPGSGTGAALLTEVGNPLDVARLDVVSQVLALAQAFSRGRLPTCLSSDGLVNEGEDEN